jgi:DNA-binding response OmpR family regulator
MIDYEKVYNETKNLTVLYVEDDKNFLKETKRVFNELFFRVDTAKNGEDGLSKYQKYLNDEHKEYDIVITDISMPYMNGIELIKVIYQINKKQAIIVISAHDESKYLLELLNMGINHFLVKPIDFDILLTVLFTTASKKEKNLLYKNELNIVKLKDGFSWDIKSASLRSNESVVKLTKKETFLMETFIKNGSKVSTFQEILNLLYDEPTFESDDILKPLISRLRKKIPSHHIENIYGLGYRLIF